ncbi:MAG: sugar O-acetyltransferase [Firmicutes bacterium]|nr:sugar O-acetyltransferase [Bacillota bacterium]
MTEKEKQHSGDLYFPGDPQIEEVQRVYLDDLRAYNEIPHTQPERRWAKLHEMFAEFGEGSYVESPFYSNFGGRNVHFGKWVYANFNLTLVDDTHIYVGDDTMIGPNVTIATAGHPIDPTLRRKGLQYNIPVHIGKNCWLGAGVIVLPGVTIGDNTVVGAGSIVTKDLPSGVVAVGNPCRVLRPVGERDRAYYFRDRQVEPALLEEEIS